MTNLANFVMAFVMTIFPSTVNIEYPTINFKKKHAQKNHK